LGRQDAVRRYLDDLLTRRPVIAVADIKRDLRGRDLPVTARSMTHVTPMF
jgi:hypothetical protein